MRTIVHYTAGNGTFRHQVGGFTEVATRDQFEQATWSKCHHPPLDTDTLHAKVIETPGETVAHHTIPAVLSGGRAVSRDSNAHPTLIVHLGRVA